MIGETYPSGLDNRTVTNTYDAINRLHVEDVAATVNTTTTYNYDAANNCSSTVVVGGSDAGTTTYTYNSLNQMTATSNGTRSEALSYNYNGNCVSDVVTGGSDAGTDTYGYDIENRLIQMVKGTTGTGTGTYTYGYDYRTRRILRDESNAGGVVTHLIFSGGTSVQEIDGTNTTPTVEYIRGSDYGGGVGGVLYTLRGSTPSYTHANRRGDIVAKTDASGSLTFQGQYNASGKVIASTGSTLDRQKSNSKDCDPWGGINDGQRISVIRGKVRVFLTRDPAGFVDGPNLYTYVVQNPWTKVDPEGLDSNVPLSVLPASEHMFDGAREAYHAGVALYNRQRSDGVNPVLAGAQAVAYGTGKFTGASDLVEGAFRQNAVTDQKMSPTMGNLVAARGGAQMILTIGGALKLPGETGPVTSPYGELSKETQGTGLQANHLNQDAAYKGVIPSKEGAAYPLAGNAITDIGSAHYDFHSSLETFWNQFRKGGAREGETPTNGEYLQAAEQALKEAGVGAKTAKQATQEAGAQQQSYGLQSTDPVPRVPGKLNQSQPPAQSSAAPPTPPTPAAKTNS